ncbi:MAG: hypothetical protein GY816_04255 [Cytophagales bacterium]|nr:hypothetical protein [Cytophagales bacterium]
MLIPEIEATSPEISVSQGESITITGTNFHPDYSQNKVYYEGRELNVTGGTQTELQVNLPSDLIENNIVSVHLASPIKIVTNIGSDESNSFSFDYDASWTELPNLNFSIF